METAVRTEIRWDDSIKKKNLKDKKRQNFKRKYKFSSKKMDNKMLHNAGKERRSSTGINMSNEWMESKGSKGK